MTATTRPHPPHLREAPAVAELFVGFFRRDLLGFYPGASIRPETDPPGATNSGAGPGFRLVEREGRPAAVDLFGVRYAIEPRPGDELPRPRRPAVPRRGGGAQPPLSPPVPARALAADGAVPRRVGRPLRRGLRRARGLRPVGHAAEPGRLDDPDAADGRALDLREPPSLDRRLASRPRPRRRGRRRPMRSATASS